jgi:hypothetical protein
MVCADDDDDDNDDDAASRGTFRSERSDGGDVRP